MVGGGGVDIAVLGGENASGPEMGERDSRVRMVK